MWSDDDVEDTESGDGCSIPVSFCLLQLNRLFCQSMLQIGRSQVMSVHHLWFPNTMMSGCPIPKIVHYPYQSIHPSYRALTNNSLISIGKKIQKNHSSDTYSWLILIFVRYYDGQIFIKKSSRCFESPHIWHYGVNKHRYNFDHKIITVGRKKIYRKNGWTGWDSVDSF